MGLTSPRSITRASIQFTAAGPHSAYARSAENADSVMSQWTFQRGPVEDEPAAEVSSTTLSAICVRTMAVQLRTVRKMQRHLLTKRSKPTPVFP